MGIILHIESASKNCSVAVSKDGQILGLKENYSADYSHAELLNPFILALLEELGLGFKDLNAISVAGGPGSYTGLRIGVTTAKTLAYSLNIPLIALNTLSIEADTFKNDFDVAIVCLDARRSDVFYNIFENGNMSTETDFTTLDEHFLENYKNQTIAIHSNCPDKITNLLGEEIPFTNQQAYFSAKNQAPLAFDAFKNKVFEDPAYFKPNYYRAFQS